MGNTIKFKDREDLIVQLNSIVLKKSDPKVKEAFEALKAALKSYKRGDKRAMQEVIKLRKKMLSASCEVYIELEEDKKFDKVATELLILDEIDDTV